MKKINSLLALMLAVAMLLSSCSIGGSGNAGPGIEGSGNGGIINGGSSNNGSGNGGIVNGGSSDNGSGNGSSIEALPFPEGYFSNDEKQGIIGSIVQTGDGNAYVSGTIPTPESKSLIPEKYQLKTANDNKHLVTLEHSFGHDCYVSGYIGNSLYIIQGFGSLAWNKKGIGHMDGTVLLDYNEDGYFSISSMYENKIIVGHPTDESVDSLWGENNSYMFGYMVYDPEAKEIRPMYEENNLRFYTAGYFINGVAMVSVKENNKVLFGIIDAEGEYIVEPKYEMMADESNNNIVIVASEAEYITDNLNIGLGGRNIYYDSTLMTNVQHTRYYECKSQTVGLINALTGESILPCSYAFIERVMDSTYFLIDNEGAKFLYDTATESMTPVEEGIYYYFTSQWMIYMDGEENAHLADKELKLYETTGLSLREVVSEINRYNGNLINRNVVSAIRDADAKYTYASKNRESGIEVEYTHETRSYTITVVEHGTVISNVYSYTNPYNGGFLYTMENSLYYYNMETGVSRRVETGYGDYTEDYDNRDATYYTSVNSLGEGVYTLRYNIEYNYGGTSYLMIIINDKGVVLFDAAINAVERIYKNYLGRYDDAIYSIAGSIDIEDNYYLTRDDGSHFLIQFVRGEINDSDSEGEGEQDYTRTVDNFSTISLLSPFTLNFTDGSEISVSINGYEVSSQYYVYNSETQSFKLLTSVFGFREDVSLYQEMQKNRFLEIIVTSGDEEIALRIEVSPFAFRF